VCHKNGLEVIGFYQAFNRDIPKGNIKKLLKRTALRILPSFLLVKLFPKPGATGFLARKIGELKNEKNEIYIVKKDKK
jgi:hypothetical protein